MTSCHVTSWPKPTNSSVNHETTRSVPPYNLGGTLSARGAICAMRIVLSGVRRGFWRNSTSVHWFMVGRRQVTLNSLRSRSPQAGSAFGLSDAISRITSDDPGGMPNGSGAQMTRAQPTHNCALNNRSSTGVWGMGDRLSSQRAKCPFVPRRSNVVVATLGETGLPTAHSRMSRITTAGRSDELAC
jgi:hypothetical protein